MSIPAIILAAGESRRMGRAKALLPFRDGTFISVLAGTLSAHFSPVYTVFGFHAGEMTAAAPRSVIAVTNPDYQLGMLTSLQAGLRALPELPERILFTLVDHPAVAAATTAELARSHAAIAIARYRGKRGHPVLLRREIAAALIAEPPSSKMNDFMDRHAALIEYIDVDDPGICEDIDDPRAYESLLARETVAPEMGLG